MANGYFKQLNTEIDLLNTELVARHMKIYYDFDYDLDLFYFLIEAYGGCLFKRFYLCPYDSTHNFITVAELSKQIRHIVKGGITIKIGTAI